MVMVAVWWVAPMSTARQALMELPPKTELRSEKSGAAPQRMDATRPSEWHSFDEKATFRPNP